MTSTEQSLRQTAAYLRDSLPEAHAKHIANSLGRDDTAPCDNPCLLRLADGTPPLRTT